MAKLPVIILAAGMGLRLRPLTKTVPKCLLKVAGKTILDHQLDAWIAAGVDEIFVVVGYRAPMVQAHCQQRNYDANIRLIENNSFKSTNNMYSLYLAEKFVRGRCFLLSNGDCVYEPIVVRQAVENTQDDFVMCQYGVYDREAMKVEVNRMGNITDISKEITLANAVGNSVDIHRFSAANANLFFGHIKRVIFEQGRRNEWFEVGLQELVQDANFVMRTQDIGAHRRVEIDTVTDLKAANKAFAQ